MTAVQMGSFRVSVARSAACAFFAVGLWIAGSRALAIDFTQNASFTTSNQSLFGTGPSSHYDATWSWSIFSFGTMANEESWIPGPDDGTFMLPSISSSFLGGSAAVDVNGAANGDVKWITTLKLDGGGVNATIPYDITIDVPTYDRFTQDGFTVGVKDIAYNKTGAVMTSTSPLLQFESKLNFTGNAAVNVDAGASFMGNDYHGSFNLNQNFTGADALNFDLISFNKLEDGKPNGQVRILSLLQIPDIVEKVLDTKKLSAKLVNDPNKLIDPATGRPSTTKPGAPAEPAKPTVASKAFSTVYEPEPIFSSSFHYPYIALDTSKDPGAQVEGLLKSQGKSEFAALEINLVSIVNKVFPNIPPLSAKANLDTPIGGGELKATALSIKVRPALNLTESETIQPLPHKLAVDFDLGQPRVVRVVAGENNVPLTNYQNVQYTSDLLLNGLPLGGLLKGQKLQFQDKMQGEDLIAITPIYNANPTLRSEFGLSLGLSLPVDVLTASAKIKFFGLEKDFKTNPYLLHADNPLAEIQLGNFFPLPASPGDFRLGGFDAIRGGMFVLSTKAYEWTGAANADMFFVPASGNPGNYTTGGVNATDAPAGQNVIIPANKTVFVHSNGTVGTLTVAGNSTVTINPNATAPVITLTLKNDVKLDMQAEMIIANNGTLFMERAAGAAIDAGGGTVMLNGADATLRTAGNLGLLSGTIAGRGKLDVGGDLIGGRQSQLKAVGGNLEVKAGTVGGASLDRLRLMADTGATLSIISSIDSARVVNGNGKIVLSRDMTLTNLVVDAGGKVETGNNLGAVPLPDPPVPVAVTLADGTLTNNGSFVAMPGSKLAAQTNELKIDGIGVLELRKASLSGPTNLANTSAKLVNGALHTIRLTGNGVAAINSERPETWLSIDNAGTIESQMDGGTALINTKSLGGGLVNDGTLRGLGDVPLTLAAGSFLNNGLFDAGQTSQTSSTGKITMSADASLQNLSNDGTKFTLTGGIYRINTSSSTMSLNLKNAPAPVDFVNKGDLRFLTSSNGADNLTINGTTLAQMQSFENLAEGGLAVSPGGKFITPKLINRGALMFFGTDAAAKTEVGNVSNEANGTILVMPGAAGSEAIVRLHGEAATATNRGRIAVEKATYDGSIKLTLVGDVPATNKFRNEGTVELHGVGSQVALSGLSLSENHAGMNGGAASFKLGKWIADEATLDLPLQAPTVLDADVKLIGTDSKVLFNGTALENTITRIGTNGALRLDQRNMTFAGPLTNGGTINLTTSSTLTVPPNAGDAPGLVNNGVIEGGGLVNQPAVLVDNLVPPTGPPSAGSVRPPDVPAVINAKVLNNGTITAINGQLTIQQDVTNLGQIRAQGPDPVQDISGGGIGLKGATISGGIVDGAITPGGTIDIDESAALWGWGIVSAANLNNDGTIMANDFNESAKIGVLAPRPLTIVVTPGVVNKGEMVATAGQTLTLISDHETLDNVGTPSDPNGGTLAVPGYLRVGFVMADSGIPKMPFNGHMIIDTTTVDGGALEVRGGTYPEALYDPDTGAELPITAQPIAVDNWASVDGPDATLDGVFIDVDQGVLRSRESGKRFTITPAFGSEAIIWGSFVLAENGGIVLLNGTGNILQKYSLFGTEVIARGASGADKSRIELANASIEGGQFKAEDLGEFEIKGNLRFTTVSSAVPLSVPAGKTLEIAKVFYGVGGRLDIENNAVLKLDGSIPIGAAGTSGADVLGGDIHIKQGGTLQVSNIASIIGARLTNDGAISLDAGQSLTVVTSPDSPQPSTQVSNTGAISINATTLTVKNATLVGEDMWAEARGTLVQTAGSTNVASGGRLDANFNLDGGLLKGNGAVTGKVMQIGGDVSPGSSSGTLSIGGDYVQATNGRLFIELGGASNFDKLVIDGAANLAGTLETVLIDGFNPTAGSSFQILTATGGIVGNFSATLLPSLATGLTWQVLYATNSVTLSIAGPLLGDYNQNGKVDAADYVVWRKTLGQTGTGLAADGNANGQIDVGDYSVWRSHFGQTAASGSSSNATVPEPGSALLLILGAAICSCTRIRIVSRVPLTR